LGISAEVKFISIRGFSGRMAALKSGVIDSSMHSNYGTADIVTRGRLRLLVSTADYLPKNWSFYVFFARNDFLEKDPAMVKRAVSTLKQALEEARSHRSWVKGVLKKELGFSEKAAQYVSDTAFPKPPTGVRMDGLKAVRDFMLEYGLIKKGKVLPLEKIVAREFVE
jgi:ABC-type nitrate/sulfonate/bicarbonate transport system substrate-binding protein